MENTVIKDFNVLLSAREGESRVRRNVTTCFTAAELPWALDSLNALHGKCFPAEVLACKFPATDDEPPHESTLIQPVRRLGLKVEAATVSARRVVDRPLPRFVTLEGGASTGMRISLGVIDIARAE